MKTFRSFLLTAITLSSGFVGAANAALEPIIECRSYDQRSTLTLLREAPGDLPSFTASGLEGLEMGRTYVADTLSSLHYPVFKRGNHDQVGGFNLSLHSEGTVLTVNYYGYTDLLTIEYHSYEKRLPEEDGSLAPLPLLSRVQYTMECVFTPHFEEADLR